MRLEKLPPPSHPHMKWDIFKYIFQSLRTSLVIACMAVFLRTEDLQRTLHTFQSGVNEAALFFYFLFLLISNLLVICYCMLSSWSKHGMFYSFRKWFNKYLVLEYVSELGPCLVLKLEWYLCIAIFCSKKAKLVLQGWVRHFSVFYNC